MSITTSEKLLSLFGSDLNKVDESVLDVIELALFSYEIDRVDEALSLSSIKSQIDKSLKKAGIHVSSSRRGIVQYLISAGSGIAKLFYYLMKGDKEGAKKILKSVKKEDIIDFLLRLDTLTLHYFTSYIHAIDALTGWHIWAAISDKLHTGELLLAKFKETINNAKELVKKVFNKEVDKQKQLLNYISRLEQQAGLTTAT